MNLDFDVDREGARVIVSVRDASGRGVTLDLKRSAANALAASLVVASQSEEDMSTEFSLRGELTTTTEKP